MPFGITTVNQSNSAMKDYKNMFIKILQMMLKNDLIHQSKKSIDQYLLEEIKKWLN